MCDSAAWATYRRVVRPEQPGGYPGAVHQEEQLAGQGFGVAQAGLAAS
jgi:hypothetical protein